MLIIFAICIILTSISTVNAITVEKLSSPKITYDEDSILDNENAPKFVKTPKKYSISKEYSKTQGFEKKKNILKTKEGKKYKFVTKYFLPVSWKNGGKNGVTEYWYNCQAVVVKGNYMYILTSSGYNINKGFIIRYNTKVLDKYLKGNGMSKLRQLGADMRENNNLTNEQKRLKKAIKIGPIFKLGHGQSLSYNPKTKSLWMWWDNNKKSTTQKLMHINMFSLKPKKIYTFSVIANGKKLQAFRNLAFDSKGNFYVDYTKKTKYNPNGYSMIFTGKLTNNRIQMKLLTVLKNRPGTYSQSIAINSVNKRLYLVSDGVFYSMPLNKLRGGTLTQDDLYYSVFNTKREFEGISFDSTGKSYLLLIRGSEILVSNTI